MHFAQVEEVRAEGVGGVWERVGGWVGGLGRGGGGGGGLNEVMYARVGSVGRGRKGG